MKVDMLSLFVFLLLSRVGGFVGMDGDGDGLCKRERERSEE